MVKINWTNNAIKDLRKIFDYVSEDSELYASRLINTLVSSVDQLTDFPYSGRIIPEKNDESQREIIIGNYRVFYRVHSNSKISILRVHHSAKKIK